MKKPTILIEPHVDSIIMPENLRVGLMVAEQRKKCHKEKKCNAEYYGFGFGQSPFHVPDPIARALAANTEKGHYSDAEGIYELRQAVAGFTKRHFKMEADPSEIIIGPGTKQLIHMVFDIVRGDGLYPHRRGSGTSRR